MALKLAQGLFETLVLRVNTCESSFFVWDNTEARAAAYGRMA